MKIREVNENKKQFISLLLLADEQESIGIESIRFEYEEHKWSYVLPLDSGVFNPNRHNKLSAKINKIE